MITVNETNLKFYLNGINDGDRVISARSINSDFHIGARKNVTSSYNYKGSGADVRIYDTALTAEEVGRIYAESKDSYLAYE